MHILLTESFYRPKGKACSSFEIFPKRCKIMLHGVFTPQQLRHLADACENGLEVPRHWVKNKDGQFEQ